MVNLQYLEKQKANLQKSLNITVKEPSPAAAQENSQNSFFPISPNTSSGKLMSCVARGFAELQRQVCISASLSHLLCRKDHHSMHRVWLDFSEGESGEPLWGEKFKKKKEYFYFQPCCILAQLRSKTTVFHSSGKASLLQSIPMDRNSLPRDVLLYRTPPLLCYLIQPSMK